MNKILVALIINTFALPLIGMQELAIVPATQANPPLAKLAPSIIPISLKQVAPLPTQGTPVQMEEQEEQRRHEDRQRRIASCVVLSRESLAGACMMGIVIPVGVVLDLLCCPCQFLTQNEHSEVRICPFSLSRNICCPPPVEDIGDGMM